MSISITPYSVPEFNKLPDLSDAEEQFTSANGEKFVLDTLRPILFKHNLQDTFGFTVLFKYIDIQDNDKMVECNGEFAAWDLDGSENVSIENILPRAWRIVKGSGLMVYEFTYREGTVGVDLSDGKCQALVREFVEAVEAGGFQDMVGLIWRGPIGSSVQGGAGFVSSGPERGPDEIALCWCFDTQG